MPSAAELPAGPPLGFPRCQKCPYVRVGPAHICVSCARRSLEPIASRACPVCSQLLTTGGTCPNWLCSDPGRRIQRIDAIAYSSGELKQKIHRYKYNGKTGWALVFGRLLLGWLDAHAASEPPGLIIANPTYLAPVGARIGHIEAIIRSAANEDLLRRWPFDVVTPEAVIKTQPTPQSAGITAGGKRAAGHRLRSILQIPDPARTAGCKILVFDDVCTTGSQLDAVAGCLLDHGGAAQVRGLVLARPPGDRNNRAPFTSAQTTLPS